MYLRKIYIKGEISNLKNLTIKDIDELVKNGYSDDFPNKEMCYILDDFFKRKFLICILSAFICESRKEILI